MVVVAGGGDEWAEVGPALGLEQTGEAQALRRLTELSGGGRLAGWLPARRAGL
uniref:Uncharacterized protein n=1 Tax=Oryza sativa subsp. japonica TaxID=39947 RepID=Q6YZR5_ORYSJ|nr:hypothetical protein [Oryza sativa Japonica Group]